MEVIESRFEESATELTRSFDSLSIDADVVIISLVVSPTTRINDDNLLDISKERRVVAVAIVECLHRVFGGVDDKIHQFDAIIIHKLAVNPNNEGQGYGRQLIKAIATYSLEHPGRFGDILVAHVRNEMYETPSGTTKVG